MSERLLKRLRKKAKRGMRGWPVATIALRPRWPSASCLLGRLVERDARLEVVTGHVRTDPAILGEIINFSES